MPSTRWIYRRSSILGRHLDISSFGSCVRAIITTWLSFCGARSTIAFANSIRNDRFCRCLKSLFRSLETVSAIQSDDPRQAFSYGDGSVARRRSSSNTLKRVLRFRENKCGTQRRACIRDLARYRKEARARSSDRKDNGPLDRMSFWRMDLRGLLI